MNLMYYLRGYPIPPKLRSMVKWVNGLPHYSSYACNVHRNSILDLGKNQDMSNLVLKWLQDARVHGCEEVYSKYKSMGPEETFNYITYIAPEAVKSYRFLQKMVMEEESQWKQDPTLGDTDYPKVVSILKGIIDDIDNKGLREFEQKSLIKYASDASRRNFDNYVAQVIQNYVPNRKDFLNRINPNWEAYDTSLRVQYDMFKSDKIDNYIKLVQQGDFIVKSRHDTFGGAPYYKNMGDFISNEDDGDLTTWADRYNELALLWLFLPVKFKMRVSDFFNYTALERVQTGGLSEYTGKENSLSDFKSKDNKQRFVQAESAIFPKAFKAIHDVILDIWRNIPLLGADKISEEATSDALKTIAENGVRYSIDIQGADFTNFDASIDIAQLDDDYFNVIRLNMPRWVNSYIVDPYFAVAFRSSVYVPGVGQFVSTGIKSGMIITNQGDCLHANLVDIYELVRWAHQEGMSYERIIDVTIANNSIN